VSDQDQLVQRLRAGLRVTEEAGVPKELQSIAFRHALEALSGRDSAPKPPAGISDEDSSANTSFLEAIASRLKLDLDVVTHVFEEENEQVHLIVTKNKLPDASSKAAAMRNVALLLVAGRQASGIEDYTAASVIRRECEELKVLDASNFAVELGRLGMRTRGGPKSREVHASRHQLDLAGELIREIAVGNPK
jgi:hypothetical protein